MRPDDKRHVLEVDDSGYDFRASMSEIETVCGLWLEGEALAYDKDAIDDALDRGERCCRRCVRVFYRRWHDSRGVEWTEELAPA